MPSAKGWVYVRQKKTKAGEGGWWPEKKKIETVLTYLTTGSPSQTVMITGVPRPTLTTWRKTAWWKEIEQQLLEEDNAELDAKYTKVIKKTLEVISDRIDNGDFKLNQKTGEVLRVPVSLNDTNKTLKDIAQQRVDLRKNKSGTVEKQETVNDKLIKLASQFAEMALQKKPVEKHVGEVYEGDFANALDEERKEGLQVRVPEVSGQRDTEEEPRAA